MMSNVLAFWRHLNEKLCCIEFYYVLGSTVHSSVLFTMVYFFASCVYILICRVYTVYADPVFLMTRPFIICTSTLHLDRWLSMYQYYASDFEFVNLPNYLLKTFALKFLNSKLKPLTCKKSLFISINKMWNLHQVKPGFVYVFEVRVRFGFGPGPEPGLYHQGIACFVR